MVWTDHHSDQVLQFDAEQVRANSVRTHMRPTAQHGSGVRAEHEFFADVHAELEGIRHLLVTGSHTAVSDPRHDDKHRARTAARIVAYDVAEHPSEKPLVPLARAYFLKHSPCCRLCAA